jgi:Rieske Fe-S protein
VDVNYLSEARPATSGGILVLFERCTGEGCSVVWRPEYDFSGIKGWLRCPCHGELYTRAGYQVLGWGSPSRPLDTVEARFEQDGSLTVLTNRVVRGGPDNAQRAVLLPP